MSAVMAMPSLQAIRHERIRRDFLSFKQHVWWMPQELKIGHHTKSLADRLTQAVVDFKAGKSTFLQVKMPVRHGKSDDISRAFPAYVLGELREYEPDVIMASYAANLSETFSRKVKQIVQGDEYQELYPSVKIDANRDAINQWAIEGSTGEVSAVGIRGSITGKGGHVVLIDDYCRNREDAESPLIREKVWHNITNDIMTRMADVCIFIICATPWHVDDPHGRIPKEMAKDPDFPRFEELCFPAMSEDYPSGYLFPERYGESWYKSLYAALGKYAAAGLLGCNPEVREGNIFKTQFIQFHESIDEFPDIQYRRGWDLASSEKQRTSSDPDFTCGAKAGARTNSEGALELWISDLVYCREEAPARNRLIDATQAKDGAGVSIKIEAVAGYKDAYTTLKRQFRGRAHVEKVGAYKDKVAKLSFLEVVFEAGNVHMLRADWNDFLIKQFAEFPKGHDDGPDAVYVAIEDFSKQSITAFDRSTVGI